MQSKRRKRKIKSVCNFIGLENKKLNYQCKECKKRWLMPINGLINKFPNLYQLCNENINKLVFLLRKFVYPHEYMDSWKKFDEASLADKRTLYSELYQEDITDKDYTHPQKLFEELELKDLGDYHNLYVQSDTLLLTDVLENVRNKYIEIYELDPTYFFSAPGLAWKLILKRQE